MVRLKIFIFEKFGNYLTEILEGNISSILKELEKVVKEQTLLQDKIQKVEVNNEILSNKVLDLNKSLVR